MSLAPVPQPGVQLFPGFIARKPEALIFRQSLKSWTKDRTIISFRTPNGEPGNAFLELECPSRKIYSLKANGKEVMRLMKEPHSMSLTKLPDYHGIAPNGQKMFSIHLKAKAMGFGSTQFFVETPTLKQRITVERPSSSKITAYCNGQPVMYHHQKGRNSSLRRLDFIDVAPGMDLLLSISLVIALIDKEKDDSKAAAAAV